VALMKAGQKSSETAWESEREQLIAERDQLMQHLSETEEAAAIALERQISSAVEKVRRELAAENEKLRSELRESTRAAETWTAERSRLQAESDHTAQLLSGSDEAAAIALERQVSTAVERARADLSAKLEAQKKEHERALAEIEGTRSGKFHKEMTAVVASVRQELEAEAGKLRKEIEGLKGERDQAQMQLADLRNEHSHCQGSGDAAAMERMQSELERVREQLAHAKEMVAEYEQLAAEREQTNKLLTETLEKQRGSQLQNDQTASEARNREIAAAVQKVRDEMKAEGERVRQEWDTELSRLADESSTMVDEKNRLQEDLERASKAATQREEQLHQLQQDLDNARRALAETQTNGSSGNGDVDVDVIREEVVRVEASLHAIIKAIEDPSAELSFVVRKNVERAQLDSYLQGLRFATGGK